MAELNFLRFVRPFRYRKGVFPSEVISTDGREGVKIESKRAKRLKKTAETGILLFFYFSLAAKSFGFLFVVRAFPVPFTSLRHPFDRRPFHLTFLVVRHDFEICHRFESNPSVIPDYRS